MDEIKTQKQEEKVEFNLDEEVKVSTVIKSYPATAQFVVENGKFKNYSFKCLVEIAGKKHTRLERLRNEFTIKTLLAIPNNTYKAEFQIRKNNTTDKLFYCWVIEIFDDLKHSMLVNLEERKFLEHFVLPKEYVEKKQEKVAK